MKRLIIQLKDLIKRGIVRIFPTAEEAYNAFLRFQLFAILITLLLVCCSCGSTKMVTPLVEHVQKDTIYLSNIQYDSIYIFQERDRDYHRRLGTLERGTLEPDTVFIKDVSAEYRYKLLRDTVRIVQRDSIPYEETVTEIKEIQRPLTWFDHLSRICFGICPSGLLITILCLIKGIRTKL